MADSDRFIRASAEWDNSAHDTVSTIADHARRRGARAWQLAKDLRKECGLPPTDLPSEKEYDFTQHLLVAPPPTLRQTRDCRETVQQQCKRRGGAASTLTGRSWGPPQYDSHPATPAAAGTALRAPGWQPHFTTLMGPLILPRLDNDVLQSLLDSAARESSELEFKSDFSSDNPDHRRGLLDDACVLANARG